MSSSVVFVYTAGIFETHPLYGPRSAIGVYWEPNHPLNVGEQLDGVLTKRLAELRAVLKALTQAKDCGRKAVKICTESQYFMSVAPKLTMWKAKGWKLEDGSLIENIEDLQLVDQFRREMNCSWSYVFKTGNVGMAEAFRLAKESFTQSGAHG